MSRANVNRARILALLADRPGLGTLEVMHALNNGRKGGAISRALVALEKEGLIRVERPKPGDPLGGRAKHLHYLVPSGDPIRT